MEPNAMLAALRSVNDQLFDIWHATYIAEQSDAQLTFPDRRLQHETLAVLHAYLLQLSNSKRDLQERGMTNGLLYHTTVVYLDFWTYLTNQLMAGYMNGQQHYSTG
ncbi:uncharacterized protein LOC125766218 [Anopheles funestus]|uniref:uncharacterized protein LOC125766218 n=1 Tax=Anopheles funestus TaxID=62324 RepID=UPI0020C6C0B5|nr:uncharacterized protein LOC125766218 [Anopheles funestus]